MTVTDLVARCESADGPDRMLDAEIAATLKIVPGHDPSRYIVPLEYRADHRRGWVAVDAVHPDGTRHCCHAREALHYTASIDAALTLAPEGWALHMLYEPSATKGQEAVVWPPGVAMPTSTAKTLPLAICAAALRARAT